MYGPFAEFVTVQPGDSAEFIVKARALAVGVAKNFEPARLYVIRIDNWFGPKWMHFAGKFTAGKRLRGLPTAAIGVHKTRLHVPPFVPSRVVEQVVFAGPKYEETLPAKPLHIECPSKQALSRRIEDVDEGAAFVWISGNSEAQKRGAMMVYWPVAFDPGAPRRGRLGRKGGILRELLSAQCGLGAIHAAWSISQRDRTSRRDWKRSNGLGQSIGLLDES
ncbi:MAG: hypothetical protein JST28_01735 [Acidobacteria bacterium]|nr:hypothetical protein [Acidobacteriota bacterium]